MKRGKKKISLYQTARMMAIFKHYFPTEYDLYWNNLMIGLGLIDYNIPAENDWSAYAD